MEYTYNDKKLVISFEGEVNSNNSEAIYQDIKEYIGIKQVKQIILDFDKLTYISSAGLRMVLKLKKEYNDVSIINVSSLIYEILDMTGFSEMLSVKKALKVVSVKGAKVIGEGFFSTVYRIQKDMIIKVFNRVSDEEQIERELSLAKKAFVSGIPTAISFDIVKVEDGKLGVRFEMLDCMSLRDMFLKYPDKYDSLVDKYVALLKKINTTSKIGDIPSMKKFYLRKVDYIKDYLDEKYYLKAKDILESIEETNTFVHGDCHFKNIMVQGEDFLLIDMDTLSFGNSIFELAQLRATYIAFNEDDKGNALRFLGLDSEFVEKLYYDILNRYVDNLTDEYKNKIAIVCYIHMVWWNRVNEPANMTRFNGCKERLIKLRDLIK